MNIANFHGNRSLFLRMHNFLFAKLPKHTCTIIIISLDVFADKKGRKITRFF